MEKFVKRLIDNSWELAAMFVLWLFVFAFKIPVNFFLVLFVTFSGYFLGEVMRRFLWKKKIGRRF